MRKIFSNEFAFTIPMYQRPYSWGTEHAEALLTDLLAAFRESGRSAIDDLDPYFLGSIVLIKGDDRPEAQVVDGQQRLTTLSILLAALRASCDQAFADGLSEFLYERGNPVAGTPNRYRLTIRELDADFFREHVQSVGGLAKLAALDPAGLTDSRKNLRNNAALFLERLQQLEEPTRERLAQFVVQRCFLVAVSTPDLDAAYRIFSVLNERGLDLSHADILKSETIGRLPEERQREYAKKWEEVETTLGTEAFGDLFAHVRMIYAKSKPRETVLQGFRAAVVPRVADSAHLVDEVIIPYARAYDAVRNAAFEATHHADEINDLLGWLNRIDNVDWIPPALAFVKKETDPGRIATFLADLERLAASLYVRRANINARIERFGRLLTAIETGSDLTADTSPLQLASSEKADTRAMIDGNVYLETTRLYVLLRLDAALSSGGARYDHSVVSVEHVLPQTMAAASQWARAFTTATHDAWVHRLANLVLLTRRKNSEAQNFDFDVKKSKYFSGRRGVSPFQLTTQVISATEWTPSILETRQRELVAVLARLWRL